VVKILFKEFKMFKVVMIGKLIVLDELWSDDVVKKYLDDCYHRGDDVDCCGDRDILVYSNQDGRVVVDRIRRYMFIYS
jgi:hypothetical protein